MAARLVQWNVAVGDVVPAGFQIAVLEAMKMEHLLLADAPGRVLELRAVTGAYLGEGQVLVRLSAVANEAVTAVEAAAVDPDHVRADLRRVLERQAFTLDVNRPAAVAKRHAQGGRTARENIAALCDLEADGSFIEYGIGTVNAGQFGAEQSRCVIMAYDYTVLAGTQGWRNHHKKDRMLALAHQLKLPVVLFAEGGGGRPGDVDMPIVAGLNNHTFSQFAALSGLVPVVGIVHGRCFAGNAALLGCVDCIIATEASNIGMGGPAMIEGGGLGSFRPEEIGPSAVQSRNGVIDILVRDEVEAVRAARHAG